jgi:hypothetical protein
MFHFFTILGHVINEANGSISADLNLKLRPQPPKGG